MKCEMITATSLPTKLSSIVKNVKSVLKLLEQWHFLLHAVKSHLIK